MGHAVVFSAQADRDLGKIVRFLAQNNPGAAERLGNALVDRALSLAAMPHIGPALRERPRVRRLVHKPWFVIYYRVDVGRQVVEIIRIWDGRQNPESLRFE
jgi:plasmid stabilization system protein ParE